MSISYLTDQPAADIPVSVGPPNMDIFPSTEENFLNRLDLRFGWVFPLRTFSNVRQALFEAGSNAVLMRNPFSPRLEEA